MKIFFSLFLVSSLLLMTPLATQGAENYTLLESIADFDKKDPAPRLDVYLQGIFVWLIRIAAVLAVISLIWAGVQYTATSLNESLKGQAKTRIQNVAFGLLGVIGAYFILQLINPALVKFELNIPAINAGGSAPIIPTDAGYARQPRMTAEGGIVVRACQDCNSLAAANIPLKPGQGTVANKTLIAKLSSLNAELEEKGVGWRVTEAHPPKAPHTSPCHADGTCVDANITSDQNAKDLNAFFDAAQRAGLSATYEVGSDPEFQRIKNMGYKGTMKTYSGADPHFHLKMN